jgi:hypothetical protein
METGAAFPVQIFASDVSEVVDDDLAQVGFGPAPRPRICSAPSGCAISRMEGWTAEAEGSHRRVGAQKHRNLGKWSKRPVKAARSPPRLSPIGPARAAALFRRGALRTLTSTTSTNIGFLFLFLPLMRS